jgi:menaquinone-dependent protoporphyrinogen IX oxidase
LKGLIVFDSYYGNTKKVAEAILEQIVADGHEGELRSVKEDYPTPPQGDFLFVGSPNRMSSVTGKTRRFVKKLDVSAWQNKPVVVFTTVLPLPKDDATEKAKKSAEKWILGAGLKLRDLAKARGLNAVDKVLYLEVVDGKGPLAENALEKTKQYTHEFVQSLMK